MGLKSQLDILYNAMVNNQNVVLTRYPANALGALVTEAGAAAFGYKAAGAGSVTLVAAGTNTTGMWVCGAGLTVPSVTSIEYVLWIGRGIYAAGPPVVSPARLAELTFRGIVSAGAAASVIIAAVPESTMLPFPLFVPVGVGISGDVATSGNAAETARATVIVATGLGS